MLHPVPACALAVGDDGDSSGALMNKVFVKGPRPLDPPMVTSNISQACQQSGTTKSAEPRELSSQLRGTSNVWDSDHYQWTLLVIAYSIKRNNWYRAAILVHPNASENTITNEPRDCLPIALAFDRYFRAVFEFIIAHKTSHSVIHAHIRVKIVKQTSEFHDGRKQLPYYSYPIEPEGQDVAINTNVSCTKANAAKPCANAI